MPLIVPSTFENAGPPEAREQADTVAEESPAWARWVAAGGVSIIGLSSLISAFSSYAEQDAGTSGYLVIALLDSLLLVGFAVLAAFAVHAVLVHARSGAGPAGAVAGAAVVSAVFSGDQQGLGVLACLGALAAAAGVVTLAATDHNSDPLGVARHLALASGVGCGVLALRAGVEASYFSAGSYGVGCVFWLATGAALLTAWSMLWSQQTGRWLVAGAAAADLLALTTANEGRPSGCLLFGLHLGVLALLYLPAPARAAHGQDPLPWLTHAKAAMQRKLSSTPPVVASETSAPGLGSAPGTQSWSSVLAKLPAWMYIAAGLGAVVFIAGLITWTSHTSAGDACFIAGNRSFGLVRDTPDCDAAFAGEDTGKLLMAVGALIAIAPFRLVSWWEKHQTRDTAQDEQR